MKRLALILLLLSAFLSVGAQNRKGYGFSNVPVDSLARFLRSECGVPVYCVKDTSDKSLFTISSPVPLTGAAAEAFRDECFKSLRSGGYTVSEYDGRFFILPGLGLERDLPAGYFLPENTPDDGSLPQPL